MRKLVALVALAFAVTVVASAQGKKTMTAIGTVKSVSASSITVTDKTGKDWTFDVDAQTNVIATGAGRKTAAAKKEGKSGISITEAVKEGSRVTVTYHDMGGGKMHAASVRVTSAAAAKK